MANCVSAHSALSAQAPASSKTRRAILTSAAAAIVAAPAIASSPATDPIYPVWRRWRDLEEEAARLNVESKKTWDAMPSWARNPRVLVLVGRNHKGEPSGNLFYASTPKEIRQIMAFDHPQSQAAPPEKRAEREARAIALEAELQQAIQASDDEQEGCGYVRIEKQVDEIMAEQAPLLDRIEETPSRSAVALAAKIDIGLAHSRREDFFSDYPHSIHCGIVREVFQDLPSDMQAALARAASLEGRIGELYWRRADA